MRVATLIFSGLLLATASAPPARAQSAPADKPPASNPASSPRDVVPLPSIKNLTAEQAAGKKLFVQRCSVCHLPALPSYTAFGPLLDKDIVSSWGDDAIRQRIRAGSVKMPGFQYTLTSAEIEQIVGYLKTLQLPKEKQD
jgi:mono/diheme cytochrome c family protein